MVDLDITNRWGKGTDHHPKSIELMRSLARIDRNLCGGYFDWETGGDGDNGETLMYQLDIYFECLDAGLNLKSLIDIQREQ